MSKAENEKSESVHKKMIKVQKVSRQENKTVNAGKRFELLKERSDGFLQSLIIAWNGSTAVPVANIQLDLGKHGVFNVDFEEYL